MYTVLEQDETSRKKTVNIIREHLATIFGLLLTTEHCKTLQFRHL